MAANIVSYPNWNIQTPTPMSTNAVWATNQPPLGGPIVINPTSLQNWSGGNNWKVLNANNSQPAQSVSFQQLQDPQPLVTKIGGTADNPQAYLIDLSNIYNNDGMNYAPVPAPTPMTQHIVVPDVPIQKQPTPMVQPVMVVTQHKGCCEDCCGASSCCKCKPCCLPVSHKPAVVVEHATKEPPRKCCSYDMFCCGNKCCTCHGCCAPDHGCCGPKGGCGPQHGCCGTKGCCSEEYGCCGPCCPCCCAKKAMPPPPVVQQVVQQQPQPCNCPTQTIMPAKPMHDDYGFIMPSASQQNYGVGNVIPIRYGSGYNLDKKFVNVSGGQVPQSAFQIATSYNPYANIQYFKR